MRVRLISSLLGVTMALAGAAAWAQPGTRLGGFEGTHASMAIQNRVAALQGPDPMKVSFKLRGDRNRLYIEYKTPAQRVWRQSMVVVRDVKLPTGERVIDYMRPGNASRSGKFNLARLSEYTNADFKMQNMAGGGRIVVKPDGKLQWTNVGRGNVRSEQELIDYQWQERFTSKDK